MDSITREAVSDILASALDHIRRAGQISESAAKDRELGVARRLLETALQTLGADPPATSAPDGDVLYRIGQSDDLIPMAPLTLREEEVLRLMASGLRNKEIAAQLGISERTATFHVGNVLAKFGADGRVEAIHLARRRGLI